MKKILFRTLFYGSALALGVTLGHNTKKYRETKMQSSIDLLSNELDSLVRAKYELSIKCIPDSIAEIARTASYELMYVESESNDYWKYKADIRLVSEYALKYCPMYREICSSIEEKEKKLNILTSKTE